MKFNLFKTAQELTDAQAEVSRLIKALADKETELEQIRKTNDELTDSNLELGKQVENLKADVEAAKKSASKEAANILANVGVPEGTIKDTPAAAKTEADILAEFNTLRGAAQTKFYQSHREAILRAQGAK